MTPALEQRLRTALKVELEREFVPTLAAGRIIDRVMDEFNARLVTLSVGRMLDYPQDTIVPVDYILRYLTRMVAEEVMQKCVEFGKIRRTEARHLDGFKYTLTLDMFIPESPPEAERFPKR